MAFRFLSTCEASKAEGGEDWPLASRSESASAMLNRPPRAAWLVDDPSVTRDWLVVVVLASKDHLGDPLREGLAGRHRAVVGQVGVHAGVAGAFSDHVTVILTKSVALGLGAIMYPYRRRFS